MPIYPLLTKCRYNKKNTLIINGLIIRHKEIVLDNHRSIMLSVFRKLGVFLPLVSLLLGKTFQNLKVSSPAPVTIVLPSGLIAKYKTR
jgi:hypothetical protein